MEEIICPYTWFCGAKFGIDELSEHESERVKLWAERKKTFMFIDCPKCSTNFQFNPVEWKATAMYSNPNEKIAKEVKSTKELLKILEKSDVEMPQSYLDYLISEKFKSKISIVKGQDKFHLYNLDELCETVNIDGNSCLRIAELKSYVKSLTEVFSEGDMDEFSLSELSNCLTIGYKNEAILFLDYRDKDSLWIFHPDGGDIESTKMTLKKIVKQK